MDRERVLETRLEHLKHLSVVVVVADVVENVLVGDDVERTEDDDDGDVVADVGQRRLDRRAALRQQNPGEPTFPPMAPTEPRT